MRFGWIGVGVMGRHMASHLMAAGHEARVFSRTASKCQPLVERGAVLAASPREAAEDADVVFTMVGAPQDVETVILGDDGALTGLSPGSLLVDMTTSTPTLALHIAAWAASQGVLALDAPVSGGDVGAEAQHPYRHPRMLRWGPPALWSLPRGWIRSSWTLKKGMSSLPRLL